MWGLHNKPKVVELAGEKEEPCPDVLLLYYRSPTALCTRAVSGLMQIRMVVVCHRVQGTAKCWVLLVALELDEVDSLCAGIHHFAFSLRFAHQGLICTRCCRNSAVEGRIPRLQHGSATHDSVRYAVPTRLGYCVTESSEHSAGDVPRIIRCDRAPLLQRYGIASGGDSYPAEARVVKGSRCVRQRRQRIRWGGEAV